MEDTGLKKLTKPEGLNFGTTDKQRGEFQDTRIPLKGTGIPLKFDFY